MESAKQSPRGIAGKGDRMSDLIDKQAALDIYDDYNVAVENGELEAYGKHRKRLLELPPAQSEPKSYRMGYQAGYAAAQRWIPCKTRKPEKSGLYLVTKQQKTGEIQLATAHYNTAFDEWSGNGNFKKVLAWQPLPSPWKGSQDGD